MVAGKHRSRSAWNASHANNTANALGSNKSASSTSEIRAVTVLHFIKLKSRQYFGEHAKNIITTNKGRATVVAIAPTGPPNSKCGSVVEFFPFFNADSAFVAFFFLREGDFDLDLRFGDFVDLRGVRGVVSSLAEINLAVKPLP